MSKEKKMAEELIARGEATNDEALIKLGKSILDKLGKKKPKNVDKEVRQDNGYMTTIRKHNHKPKKRYVYDEDGNVKGTLARSEPLNPDERTNTFVDDRKLHINDPEDRKIKKLGIITRCERPPAKFVTVVCDKCGKKEKVNPFFARSEGDDSLYKCAKCIQKMSQK